MTIRLTTHEAFSRVLEKLKQDPFYNEEVNATFFKYCVDAIKAGITRDDDEWYLDLDWHWDDRVYKIVLSIRYHRRSEICTDVEYLEGNEADDEIISPC